MVTKVCYKMDILAQNMVAILNFQVAYELKKLEVVSSEFVIPKERVWTPRSFPIWHGNESVLQNGYFGTKYGGHFEFSGSL